MWTLAPWEAETGGLQGQSKLNIKTMSQKESEIKYSGTCSVPGVLEGLGSIFSTAKEKKNKIKCHTHSLVIPICLYHHFILALKCGNNNCFISVETEPWVKWDWNWITMFSLTEHLVLWPVLCFQPLSCSFCFYPQNTQLISEPSQS